MKAVHFGAGNIGLGFIGLLLSRSGYHVQFVDVDEERVSLLNSRGQYTVTLANEQADATVVRNVSAINGKETDRVAQAIAEADIVTTAVGVNVLPHIAASIAKGIELRLKAASRPLTVIACENAIGGSTQLKQHVYGHLSPEIKERAAELVAFPDAAVDRIVPIQQHEDKLHVTVEPFFEWVVDRSALPQDYPVIEGVHYADKLGPYIERKLFTVNTGHCCAAYHGYRKRYSTIQEAMKDEQIVAEIRGALNETGAVLVKQYGFDEAEHRKYIDKIMDRFRNPYLTDEVVRVGRSPIRKLSPNDRLVRPAMTAYSYGIDVPHLANAIAAALLFDYEGDPEAAQLQLTLKEQGIHKTLFTYTEIPESHPLHGQIVAAYESLSHQD
ncbi:mannitol-1-phosphate 5-dehydrogenase [Paenibacillus thermoaerophilus]|uniref:Mannitol-1-phosphate 5-dehydrogenase n=1 Tax=Paenibacillus thermoaerophilus TaxID=1215385 RepID=A0ABW2V2F7_9BACL|nr:mannitol-1-phosphate 5-dehydrogenase [Paenibacillus thermoaerophilus]TMV09410.1 mannitol-1-phosphate 5-dehydrogenase [Paenibacillus thermoaerophilus]